MTKKTIAEEFAELEDGLRGIRRDPNEGRGNNFRSKKDRDTEKKAKNETPD